VPAGAVGSSWASGSWSATCWEVNTWADAVTLAFILGINERIRAYLQQLYSAPTTELAPLMKRYLDAQTGDMNVRFRKLVQDATDAMT
jgi:hypothetical protein